tara:strand:+ start:4981 stop:5532 length:552 start_codon:yes stop_codon:yes gene_type:complete
MKNPIILSHEPFVSMCSGVLYDDHQHWLDLIRAGASYDQSKTSIRRDRAYCKLYQPSFWGGEDLNPLLGKVSRTLNEFTQTIGVRNNRTLAAMHDAWGLVYEDGESCGPHGHGRENEYAGTYYLEADEGCGTIYFPDADVEVEPRPGDFILFGSPVVHGVMSNTKPGAKRVCLAFNVKDRNKK